MSYFQDYNHRIYQCLPYIRKSPDRYILLLPIGSTLGISCSNSCPSEQVCNPIFFPAVAEDIASVAGMDLVGFEAITFWLAMPPKVSNEMFLKKCSSVCHGDKELKLNICFSQIQLTFLKFIKKMSLKNLRLGLNRFKI